MSSKNSIHHISPIDGRYSSKTEILSIFFSEFALIQTRVEVEIEYLIQLASLNLKGFKKFQDAEAASLRSIIEHFSESDALEVKDIESTTNHDVKAVEYFIKQRADSIGVNFNTEFIHFGLTSQDINNTAFPLMLKRYLEQNYLPNIKEIIHTLNAKSNEWKEVTLLAKTHGQPASPTTLGKEIKVFADRLEKQCRLLENVEHGGKFGGATGNFNAHKVAYPEVNWVEFGNQFLASLGLTRQQYTTQIEHYDGMAHILDTTKRIHTILIDLARDIWSYVSYEVFTQKINKNETGSSAMPHKVNPIDFENAEGNLMFANAILEFLSSKLPISRLQRDLTDSTVLRNIGVPYGHFEVAYHSLVKGFGKLTINETAINQELENNWIVIAEAIQTILRREGIAKPYELLKDFSRTNKKPSKEDFHLFIDSLVVSDDVKIELKAISPQNYIGYA
jgi:adenylosuccinate lyase